MKQTNNAIKFLMAQYRAIFKNAYLKGMATALVLTAGLAAGQSQAATADAPFYQQIGGTWSDRASWNTNTNTMTAVAGNYDDGTKAKHNDGTVSGETFVIGPSGSSINDHHADIGSLTSGSAYGGFVQIDSGATDAIASGNKVYVLSGGIINGEESGGAVITNLVGGWAKTNGSGIAQALNNELHIASGATITKANNFIGGVAAGLNGAEASGNKLTITGSAETGAAKLKLTQSGTYAGLVFVGDATHSGATGTFVAQGNELTIENVSATADSFQQKTFMGGRVMALGIAADHSIESLSALGNSVTIRNSQIGDSGNKTIADIIANRVGYEGTNAHVNLLEANGTADSGLTIENSTIYNATVFGGKAVNQSGGSATANANIVVIKDTKFLANDDGADNVLTGGYAESSVTTLGQKVNLEASSNTITIDNTSSAATRDTYNVAGAIYGGNVAVKSGSAGITNFIGVNLTANNNAVTVEDGVTVGGKSIYGAYIASDGENVKSGGATINASNNTVTFNGDFTGGANTVIAGAQAEPGQATMNNNHVVINGKVTGTAFIYGASASEQKAIDTEIDNPLHTLTNNSVTFGKDADVTGVKVWAASAQTRAVTTNNDVTIEGKLTNSDIYGGTGADSVIDLKSTGTLTYSHEADTKNSLRSDVVNLAGTVNVGAKDTLKISGYLVNGNANSGLYNINQTNVANTATVLNRGTVELFGDTTVATGAKLHALTSAALLKVNGDNTIKDEINDDDVQVDLVGGRGQLNIAEADLKSYLTSGDKYDSSDRLDSAGAVELASGGVLHFTDDSVVVSNLDFEDGATATAGKIKVGTTAGASIIKGQDLHVNHLLSSLGSDVAAGKLDVTKKADYDKLSGAAVNAAGLSLEAERLFLGATNLTEDQTAEITFEKGTAKNLIDFSVGSGDYQLTAAVAGNNYMRTQDQSDDLDFFTGLTGSITGDVDITSGGSLTIEYGHWTANDNITLKTNGTGGGRLAVGIENDPDARNYIDNTYDNGDSVALPDATLTLGQELVVDLASGGSVSISADGRQTGGYSYVEHKQNRFGIYDAALAQETVGDDHHVLLDLSNGLTMVGDVNNNGAIAGKVTVSAVSGGVINLNGTDLSAILNQNDASNVNSQSGAFFEASGHGVLNVAGNVEADFGDFGGKTGEENGIKLDADGYLIADTVQVIHEPDSTQTTLPEQGGYTAKKLDLGSATGHLVVDDLVISDTQRTTKPEGDTTGEYASTVYFAQGTADIAKSLSSVNDTLILGDTGTTATVNLFSDLVTDKGTIDVNNLRITNGSLNVQNGDWTAQNLIVDASGDVVVGGHAGDDGWTDAEDNDVASTFTAQSITMANGSLLDVKANGTMTVDSADFSNLAAATFNTGTPAVGATGVHVAGELIINGDADATLADGTDDARNGVHFGAEGSIVIAKNGYLTFGEAATTGAIIANNTYTGTTVDLIEGYSKIQNNGGMLTLGLSEGTTFDQDAILALKNALVTTGSFDGDVLKDGGVLNIGNADFEGYSVKEQTEEGLYGYTAAYSDIKPFMDITNENGYGADVTNNKYMQTNITGIQYGDPVQGVWGSFSMATGVADSAQVTIAGNTQLHYAEGNKGFFISDATHSKALGAIVEGQKDLTLVGGGEIGKVSLEQGNDDAEKNLTVLTVQGGDTTIAAIEGRLGSATTATGVVGGTVVRLESNTTVTGDIRNIDEVEAVNGAQVTAQNGRVNYISTLNSDITIADTLEFDDAVVLGGFIKAKTADMTTDIGGSEIITAHGGTFIAETLKAHQDSMLQIGVDASTLPESDAVLEDGTRVTGTGYLDVGTLELNNATLFVDPEYDEATSVAGVLEFKSGNEKNLDNDVLRSMVRSCT